MQPSTTTDPKPRKRILALDGGGVRGVIAIAFLEQIEKIGQEQGRGSRLCDQFDLVGGASTGAILSAGIAIGMTVAELRDFYFDLGPKVFAKSALRILGLQSVFDSRVLERELLKICGNITLESDRIKTGLAIITKRMDTGSAWVIHNNPNSRFWDTPPDGSYIGNRHYSLPEVVRASTAAPHYFAPELITIAEGEPPGLFVDGGLTPHNMPALVLYQLAAIPDYGYGWETTAESLEIVSVGSGIFRPTLDSVTIGRTPAATVAIKALSGQIAESEAHNLTIMQMLGKVKTPWRINSEIGALDSYRAPHPPLFTFHRYNVRLEQDWLKTNLGLGVDEKLIDDLRNFTDPEHMQANYEIGQAAAAKFIDPVSFS